MTERNILLIEDSSNTQILVKTALEGICRITTADTGAMALQKLTIGFDLILLDIQLPDIEGFDLYVKIRQMEAHKTTPIVYLSGRGKTEDKVRGFSLGADDYIVKPFEIEEFRARVAAKLKNLIDKSAVQAIRDHVTVGPFKVNIAAQKISVKRNESWADLELTANQFKILFYLMRHEGNIVTREVLLKEIWGADVHVAGRTIDSHIYEIRRQIGPESAHLKSVHGKGYRFYANPPAKKTG